MPPRRLKYLRGLFAAATFCFLFGFCAAASSVSFHLLCSFAVLYFLPMFMTVTTAFSPAGSENDGLCIPANPGDLENPSAGFEILENLEKLWFYSNIVMPLPAPSSSCPSCCKFGQDSQDHKFLRFRRAIESTRPSFEENRQSRKKSFSHRRSFSDSPSSSSSDFPFGMPGRVIIYGEDPADLPRNRRNESSSSSTGSSSSRGRSTEHSPESSASAACRNKKTDVSGTSGAGSQPNGRFDVSDSISSGSSSLNGKATQYSGNSRIARLPTIPSGTELNEIAEISEPAVRKRIQRMKQRRHRKGNRSMTDLEIYEIKGFKDLGFDFKQEQFSPHLLQVVPGLKRIGNTIPDQYSPVTRPYLSENWYTPRVPTLPHQNMKKQLKDWARAVALQIQEVSS